MLKACHFVIFTDHEPITHTFQQNRDKCSLQQFNHLDFLAEFATDIRHNSGQDSIVAYAVSRMESVTVPPSYNALAASQDSGDELKTLLEATFALRLEKLPMPATAVSIYCDMSAGRSRPYVSAPVLLQTFHSIHDLLHPGTRTMAKLVAQCFVWPGV
jgi:hypothetical protein